MSQVVCPSCDSTNTRRIQNELAKIKNPVFSQGKEWLGYCSDCGCLYNYYEDTIVNIPRDRESMKCPKCGVRIFCPQCEDKESSRKCPKCGTRMRTPNYMHKLNWCPKCGHEEKAKPDCYYRSCVEIGQCAVCKWFKECPMQGHSEKREQ
jgi:DNA-directed RNA polymerase subunit RPC12/RpoP